MAVLHDSASVSAVIPFLIVDDPALAVEFYAGAFNADLLLCVPAERGISHAEIRVGDSLLLLAAEDGPSELRGPIALGGTSVTMVLYVADVDATLRSAVARGATLEREIFPRGAPNTVVDPFGHRWILAPLIPEPASTANTDAVHGRPETVLA